MTETDDPLGKIFTFDEAAAQLRVSKRAFQEIVKKHPFYAKNGKVYLFSEQDIKSIWEAMREPAREKARLLGKPSPSQYQIEQSLRKLTAKPAKRKLQLR